MLATFCSDTTDCQNCKGTNWWKSFKQKMWNTDSVSCNIKEDLRAHKINIRHLLIDAMKKGRREEVKTPVGWVCAWSSPKLLYTEEKISTAENF